MQHVNGDQSGRRSLVERLIAEAWKRGLETTFRGRFVVLGIVEALIPQTEDELVAVFELVDAREEAGRGWRGKLDFTQPQCGPFDHQGRSITEKSG